MQEGQTQRVSATRIISIKIIQMTIVQSQELGIKLLQLRNPHTFENFNLVEIKWQYPLYCL